MDTSRSSSILGLHKFNIAGGAAPALLLSAIVNKLYENPALIKK
jgi:hypothetical protein